MFYSTDIKCTDVAEKLRSTDTIKVCVERLRDECYKFKFHLEGTYNSAEDCNISYETYKSFSIMGEDLQYFVSSSNQICEHST